MSIQGTIAILDATGVCIQATAKTGLAAQWNAESPDEVTAYDIDIADTTGWPWMNPNNTREDEPHFPAPERIHYDPAKSGVAAFRDSTQAERDATATAWQAVQDRLKREREDAVIERPESTQRRFQEAQVELLHEALTRIAAGNPVPPLPAMKRRYIELVKAIT